MATPQKTIKAYKLFVQKQGKLFPLYINADKPIPTGVWVDAEVGPELADGKVKGKGGTYAKRPGWHSTKYPVALHIGGKLPGESKPSYRKKDQVWAEIEIPADIDWQKTAEERASRKRDGSIIAKTAHITDQVPTGGYYTYKTNPNMEGSWYISGAMKINRILTDEEVKEINDSFGVADLPRLEDKLEEAYLPFSRRIMYLFEAVLD